MEKTQVINQNQLIALLGVSKATLWRMRRQKRIPPPIQISARVIGWESNVIEDWIKTKRSKVNEL